MQTEKLSMDIDKDKNWFWSKGMYSVIVYRTVVYDRNHLLGLGSDTETETKNWPKLSADIETNRNHKNLQLESII